MGERLVRPVAKENYDLITPIYRRHKFDALLVRTLLYPMTRAMYGKRLREPIPTDFAFSGRLATQFLAQEPTPSDVGRMGAELQLSLSAMSGDFRVGQSFLSAATGATAAASSVAPNARHSCRFHGSLSLDARGRRDERGTRCVHMP